MRKLLAALATFALLQGCTSVPMAHPYEDAQMKRFETVADKSRIYIYRNETMGAAIQWMVSIDGRMIGATAKDTYLVAEVTPGEHTISCTGGEFHMLKVTAEAGKNLYIWQEMRMGFGNAKTQLHVMSEAEGKAGVMGTKLAGTL
ncbi:DUF2846 domain-containing protein [Pseudomonas sp. NPDC090233]|uniref:DUF2846 domain-containing protein n=1 Tax=Pseudomonas sp. NPDC090233 TaxID=3364479 RepID=UPI00383B0F34